VEIVTVLSNFKIGAGAVALVIPSATLQLNVTYPEPGCDCDKETLEQLTARLGSPALGSEKTPPHWRLWVTGTIGLGSGAPGMPRFDGVSVTLTTTVGRCTLNSTDPPTPRLIGWNMCRPMRRMNDVCVGQ
jgi:hypothetical protein